MMSTSSNLRTIRPCVASSLSSIIHRSRLHGGALIGGSSSPASPPQPPDPNDFDSDIYAAVIDVDTGGTGDYTSLSAAWAAEAGNYVDNAKALAFVCRASGGVADSVATTIDATAGSTSIEIWQAAADRHEGAPTATIYRLLGLTISASQLLVDGLFVKPIASGNVGLTLAAASMSDVVIRNCVIKGNSDRALETTASVTGTCRIHNCVLIQGNAFVDVAFCFAGASGTIEFVNCSLVGSIKNDPTAEDTITCRNCLSQAGFTGGGFGDAVSMMVNCASTDFTAVGTNCRINQTFDFEDSGSDDYRITADDTGAKGYGVASGAAWDYGYDIAGNPWNNPPSTPSIGANEPQ